MLKIKKDHYSKVMLKFIKFNYREIFYFLLNQRSYNVISDTSGNGLLHIFSMSGTGDQVTRLLSAGYDINFQNLAGDTALHYAIRFNNKDVVKMLLKWGANLELKNNNNEYAIHCAAATNNFDVIKLLIEHGSRVDVINGIGAIPLHIAVEKNEIQIVKLLVAYGDFINNTRNGMSSLHLAVQNENESITIMLLDTGANINIRDSNGFSVMHYVARTKSVGLAKLLISRGANVNITSNTGQSPLHIAVFHGDEYMIALLLKHGADINIRYPCGETALHIAATENASRSFSKVCKLLIDNHANVNLCDVYGETPFHRILENGNLQTIQLFLDNGADLEIKDCDGNNALHFASKNNNREVIEFILNNRQISIEEGNISDGATALHIAAKFTKSNVIKTLIDRGADVNCPDFNGDTPMFYAAQRPIRNNIHPVIIDEYRKSIRLLLKHGADVNYETILGENVLEMSIEVRNAIMIDIIIEHLTIMEARNLSISESNKKLINTNNYLRSYYLSCKKELFEMKKRKLYGTVCFFNILVNNINSVTGFTRNPEIVHAFENYNIKESFPIYSELICDNFKKGIERKRLMGAAANVFYKIFKFDHPFHIISNVLFDYLSTHELRNLIGT